MSDKLKLVEYCPTSFSLSNTVDKLKFVGHWPLHPEVSIERAVLNRFAHVFRLDALLAFKVGKRAAYFSIRS